MKAPGSSALNIVRELFSAIEAKDLDAAMSLMADDVSYENMPMKPITGKPTILRVLRGFLEPAQEVEWQIVSECEHGDTVYNERLDRFNIGGTWLELPISGVFRIRNGAIVLWHDYFDMSTYTEQLRKITSGSSAKS